MFADQLFSRFGRIGLKGNEALPAQLEAQDPQDIRLVIDDQNTAPHLRSVRLYKPQIKTDWCFETVFRRQVLSSEERD